MGVNFQSIVGNDNLKERISDDIRNKTLSREAEGTHLL